MHGFDDFIDLLKILVREPSVVGAEHSFFRVLQRELEERGARVPTTGYHTMEETASRASVESFLALLRAVSRT